MSLQTWLPRGLAACALAVGGLGTPGSALGSDCDAQTAAVASICGEDPTICTFDDFPAFDLTCKSCPPGAAPNCPVNGDWDNTDIWSRDGRHTTTTSQGGDKRTDGGSGYQCVELALRYFYFRWGVTYPWEPHFTWPASMCTGHPTDPDHGVTITPTPVPGDLMVFSAREDNSSGCGVGTGGHVAVVNSVDSAHGNVSLVNQNFGSGPGWGSPYVARVTTKAASCTGCNTWANGTVHCGCFIHANSNVRICDTLAAPVDPPPADPSAGLDFACGNSLRDGTAADWQDWSVGYYKAECSLSQAATGLSMSMTGKRYAHDLLCREDDAARYPHTAAHDTCRTVVFNVADNRGTPITGDWDPTYLKGECAADEFVAGISQTTNQALHAILCCHGQVDHDSCTPQVFDAEDAREDPAANDWDSDYYKGECGPGRYMAGASMSPMTGIPHAILCCGRHVEPPDADIADGTTPADASPVPEAGAQEPPPPTADGGCGCRAGGARGLGGWLWLGLAGAGAVARRRRNDRAAE
jgi:hypothetical protein